MSDRPAALVRHFESIYREHMQGLPIVNTQLQVEAIGFVDVGDNEIGILITPWFMNLVLLPGGGDYASSDQGSAVELSLPGGAYVFNVTHDADVGTFLTAVMFRTVADFPDQQTARQVAEAVLETLLKEPETRGAAARQFSRRELFARLGGD